MCHSLKVPFSFPMKTAERRRWVDSCGATISWFVIRKQIRITIVDVLWQQQISHTFWWCFPTQGNLSITVHFNCQREYGFFIYSSLINPEMYKKTLLFFLTILNLLNLSEWLISYKPQNFVITKVWFFLTVEIFICCSKNDYQNFILTSTVQLQLQTGEGRTCYQITSKQNIILIDLSKLFFW